MRLRHALSALLLSAALTVPTTAATATAAGRPAPARLTDRAGRQLQLRGFNLDKYDEATQADLRSIAARGFTLVRLALTWDRLEPRPGRYDPAAFRRLDRLMHWADAYHLHVLIDFHQDVYGPAFGGSGQDGAPPWATRDDGLPFTPIPGNWSDEYFEPSVQAAFRHLYDDPDLRAAQADFYRRVALAVRNHPSLLGYDLFNEPYGPILGDPSDPAVLAASAAALERGRLSAMYRRLIAAVRSADRDSWLFVEPTVLVGEGVPTQLPGFADPRPGAPRIGYAPHFYDTAVEEGQDWNPSDQFIQRYTAAITAYPTAHHLPLLVGEWGPPDPDTPGNTLLVAAQVQAMESFADGWTMWYWTKGNGGYSVLSPDGTPHPGDAPAFGPYAPALSGHRDAESYDPATGRYTLRYDASGAGVPTLVVLPATAYPDGATVSVSGARAVVTIRQPTSPETAGRALISLPGATPGTPVTVTVTRRG